MKFNSSALLAVILFSGCGPSDSKVLGYRTIGEIEGIFGLPVHSGLEPPSYINVAELNSYLNKGYVFKSYSINGRGTKYLLIVYDKKYKNIIGSFIMKS